MAINRETLNLVQYYTHHGNTGVDMAAKDLFRDSITEEERNILYGVAVFVKSHFIVAESAGIARGGHGFDHHRRVVAYAGTLAIMEGIYPFIPMLTAMIVDVGRASSDPRAADWRHGQLSAEISGPYLDKLSTSILTSSDKLEILEAAEQHSSPNKDTDRPLTVLIKDADKLDFAGLTSLPRSAAHRYKLPVSLPVSGLESGPTEENYQSQISTIIDDHQGILDCLKDPKRFRIPSARFIAAMRVVSYEQILNSLKQELSATEEIFDEIIGGRAIIVNDAEGYLRKIDTK